MNKEASTNDKKTNLNGTVNNPVLRQEVEFLLIEKTGKL